MNRGHAPGPAVYVVVGVLLLGYFVWILDRMAAFTAHGFVRLDKLAAGMVIVVATLMVVVAIEAVRRRRARRR